MKILAHRGIWNTPDEKNSITAFKSALKHGFGIETDLRDFNEHIVISHDMPSSDAITFEKFILLVKEYNPDAMLALNIKSDGLQEVIKSQNLLTDLNYYFFDMAVPDLLGYVNRELPSFTRYSEYEPKPSLYKEAQGVWLDNFTSNQLDLDALHGFLNDKKRVAIVSPELHGFDHKALWEDLNSYLLTNPQHNDLVELCTDLPFDAKDFFCE